MRRSCLEAEGIVTEWVGTLRMEMKGMLLIHPFSLKGGTTGAMERVFIAIILFWLIRKK